MANTNYSNDYGTGTVGADGFELAAISGTTSKTPTVFHSGDAAPMTTTTGTDTTPVTTETYICEVFIPVVTTLTGISVLNGSAVAGNLFVALARSDGTILASSAATAQSGTAAYQKIPFTSTQVVRGGRYFILLQCSSTSARFRSHILGNFGASKKTGETNGTFTTITIPTTFTADLGPIADTY